MNAEWHLKQAWSITFLQPAWHVKQLPESKAAQPDESHPARADPAAATMLCCVCQGNNLDKNTVACSMAATVQLLHPLLPFMASVCHAR